MPSIPGYIYAQRDGVVYVNLYIAGRGKLRVGDQPVELIQETRYPWDGDVRIIVQPQKPAEFAVYVRVPGWATDQPVPSDLYRYLDSTTEPVTLVNDRAPLDMEKGYAEGRTWQAGDTVECTCRCRFGASLLIRRSKMTPTASHSSAGRSCIAPKRSTTAVTPATWSWPMRRSSPRAKSRIC
jgi:DUF1680 family protein